jgi:hypothetical protein
MWGPPGGHKAESHTHQAMLWQRASAKGLGPKMVSTRAWRSFFTWSDLMPDYSDKTKNDLIQIIEDIDLVDSVLTEARKVALGLLEQAERKEG